MHSQREPNVETTGDAHVALEAYLDRFCEQLTTAMSADELVEMRCEVRAHIEAMSEALRELGSTPQDATREALSRFGDPVAIGGAMRRDRDARWLRPRLARLVGFPAAVVLAGYAGMLATQAAVAAVAYATGRPFVCDASTSAAGFLLADITALIAWRERLGAARAALVGAIVYALFVSVWQISGSGGGKPVWTWDAQWLLFWVICASRMAAAGAVAGAAIGAGLRVLRGLCRIPRPMALE
jgi:hypothetical protein